MNDHQKERLLKIAETNPELAKDVVDIFKQESLSSHEPIAVKMVKSEEDKIEITAEQRKYGEWLIITYVIGAFLAITSLLSVLLTDGRAIPIAQISLFFVSILLTIALSWYFSFKAGFPVIKNILSKHFKW